METNIIVSRIEKYKQILRNTSDYRNEWYNHIKPMLESVLNEFLAIAELTNAKVVIANHIENLETITLDLANTNSGISENVENSGVKRIMVKYNGSLIYQQLFNGKIMVMIQSPYIEGYGEQKPPAPIEILRPDELTYPFIIRHLELFLKDITDWEDFDDDQPQKQHTIGFTPSDYDR